MGDLPEDLGVVEPTQVAVALGAWRPATAPFCFESDSRREDSAGSLGFLPAAAKSGFLAPEELPMGPLGRFLEPAGPVVRKYWFRAY